MPPSEAGQRSIIVSVALCETILYASPRLFPFRLTELLYQQFVLLDP